MDKDGFYFAELNGKRGLVPSNFVISFLDYRVINKQIWKFANAIYYVTQPWKEK